MAFFILYEPIQPCTQVAWDTRTRRHYYCDTAADAPASGLQVGDRRTDLDTGTEWHATDSTTWVQFSDAGTGSGAYAFSESDSANDTTANNAFQNTGCVLSPTGSRNDIWEILCHGTMVGDAAGPGGDIIDCEVVIDIDGTPYEPVTFTQYAAAAGPHLAPFHLHKLITLAGGAHTVRLKFRTLGTYFAQNAILQASHLTVKYPN